MLAMHPRCSCWLASDVRVYADRPVLEKPVEDGFADYYDYNNIDTDDDADEGEDVGDEEEPVEDGGGRWGGEKQRTGSRPEVEKVLVGLNMRMGTKLI